MHKLKLLYYGAFLSLFAGVIPGQTAVGQITFNDIAFSAGVGSEAYDSSSRHGLGIIWIDYDNDGFPDIFATNGSGDPAHLYHNEGNGSFTNADALLPSIAAGEMTSAMFADYDNDGDQDINFGKCTDVGNGPRHSTGGNPHYLQIRQIRIILLPNGRADRRGDESGFGWRDHRHRRGEPGLCPER